MICRIHTDSVQVQQTAALFMAVLMQHEVIKNIQCLFIYVYNLYFFNFL